VATPGNLADLLQARAGEQQQGSSRVALPSQHPSIVRRLVLVLLRRAQQTQGRLEGCQQRCQWVFRTWPWVQIWLQHFWVQQRHPLLLLRATARKEVGLREQMEEWEE